MAQAPRFSAEEVQNSLGHTSYKRTMDKYDTMSIDEMDYQG
jgi:hypothetical protein